MKSPGPILLVLVATLSGATVPPALTADTPAFDSERRELLRDIERDVRDTAKYLNRRSLDERVMSAMSTVPRHEFVRPEDRGRAYENRPLPIGHGQTISQPYIVAIMTDLAEPSPGCRALEVGTGSGYQAAVLGTLCDEVYTLEIIEPLGEQARGRLARLGYHNVTVRIGDGYYGWEEHAPFDVILVTAVASHVPPPLLRQLKPGGRLIVPLGSPFMVQQLVLVEKDTRDRLTIRQLMPVRFVPLTGDH